MLRVDSPVDWANTIDSSTLGAHGRPARPRGKQAQLERLDATERFLVPEDGCLLAGVVCSSAPSSTSCHGPLVLRGRTTVLLGFTGGKDC